MSIAGNLSAIKEDLKSKKVTLVAVSKTFPVEAIQEAYKSGQRVFGENRVQELVSKYEVLPKDIEWHLIGHLQTNKVKFIAPFISLIHSIDSLKLLEETNKEALKNNRVIDCLLQIYIAKEETKFGLDFEETKALLNSRIYAALKNIRIVGLMGMATNTPDSAIVRNEFNNLRTFFDELKNSFFNNTPSFKEISIGMSGDYKMAVEEGSTMIRVGSSIFGLR